MDRAQKAEFVADLNRTFNEVGVVVVTRNLGLTVAQSTVLRNKMRDAGATYKVSKNKLAKIALDGTDYLSLGDMLVGPVGLATSKDPVAAAKVASNSPRRTTSSKSSAAQWATALDAEGIKALASLPSLDELRAKIVGLIVAPRNQDRDHHPGAGGADRSRACGSRRKAGCVSFRDFPYINLIRLEFIQWLT
jgi:large subunit ribosomal protein L10